MSVTPRPRPALKVRLWNHRERLRLVGVAEREVLQLLAEGKSAKEVAAEIYVSPRTVEFHKYRIMEELGVKTSAELVHYAIKLGVVTV